MSKIFNSIKKDKLIFTKIFLVIILIPYIALLFYTYPVSDDWFFLDISKKYSISDNIGRNLKNMNSRYTNITFLNLANKLFSQVDYHTYLVIYKIFLFALMALFFFAVYYFFSTILYNIISKKHIFWLTLTFIVLYYANTINVGVFLYWLSSVSVYTIGIILLLFVLSFSIRFVIATNKTKKIIFLILTIIFCFLLTGNSEITYITAFIILLLLSFYNFTQKNKNFYSYLFIALILLLNMILLLILLKGNYTRIDTQTATTSSLIPTAFKDRVLLSLKYTIENGTDFLFKWCTKFINIAIIILLLPFSLYISQKKEKLRKISLLNIISVILTKLIILYGIYFISLFFLRFKPPFRLINVMYFVFILGFIIEVIMITIFLNNKVKNNLNIPRYLLYVGQAIFILSIIFYGNISIILEDLTQNGPSYQIQMNFIEKMFSINKMYNFRNVPICNFQNPTPKAIVYKKLMNTPDHWKNKSFANLHGMNKVVSFTNLNINNFNLLINNFKDDINKIPKELFHNKQKMFSGFFYIVDFYSKIPKSQLTKINNPKKDLKLKNINIKNFIKISGYAIDNNTKDIVGGVIIELNGQKFPAIYGFERSWLAQKENNPNYLYCGFLSFIPIDILKEKNILNVYVLSSDGTGYYRLNRSLTF